MAMLFNVFFLSRRLLMAVIIVVIADKSWLQTQLLIVTTSLALFYTGAVWPFLRLIQNKMELANEVFVLYNTYFMVIYSDFVLDANARYKMAWVNLGIMIALVLSSAGLVVINQGNTVYRSAKLYYLKRK